MFICIHVYMYICIYIYMYILSLALISDKSCVPLWTCAAMGSTSVGVKLSFWRWFEAFPGRLQHEELRLTATDPKAARVNIGA